MILPQSHSILLQQDTVVAGNTHGLVSQQSKLKIFAKTTFLARGVDPFDMIPGEGH